MQPEQRVEPQQPERSPGEERDVLMDPGDAVRAARRTHEESPEGESTTEQDKVRESGFGA
jgi:hypothetical protein